MEALKLTNYKPAANIRLIPLSAILNKEINIYLTFDHLYTYPKITAALIHSTPVSLYIVVNFNALMAVHFIKFQLNQLLLSNTNGFLSVCCL